jgi:hypothetical protein
MSSHDKFKVLRRAHEYYNLPGNDLGGSLHVVLDDGNVEGQHVLFCMDRASDEGDSLGEVLARELLCLDEAERQWVYERVHGD